ncbi:hypothetical protein SEPCBS57363_001845 [Sporothrix epigloea]|uniref:Uncharacterized protein n=1 Tax=Sporothrix epigloea TaxID=1892477 RepID=A0ABP0DCS3_9PEZI
MPDDCNPYPPEAWEDCGLRSFLGIPSVPVLSPVALLPEGEGLFQTAEQLQHMLDLTFLPEVVGLEVIPKIGWGWSKEPKSIKCAVMYNTYMTEVEKICEHGMVMVYFHGKRRCVPIPLKLTAKLDKNGRAVKRRERERNDDLLCAEALEKHTDFYAITDDKEGNAARLAYLRREAARLRAAQERSKVGDENVPCTEPGSEGETP